jgi:hypothetical protein
VPLLSTISIKLLPNKPLLELQLLMLLRVFQKLKELPKVFKPSKLKLKLLLISLFPKLMLLK